MSLFVLSLFDLNATLESVGGKGASLAKLANAGLPVPGGFHVTTAAYKQFVAENDLQPRILAALQTADAAQPATLETASAHIRDLFVQAAIPRAIADEIRAAYTALSNPHLPVAIRSSATAEDLPGASFAGQQDTYLNIQGVDAVLDAVRRCWASLWTARAIGYRARQGIDPDAVSLAVVVQTLVFADAAGVMFTANPLNGRRDQAVINATWGLGEAVVGGLVTPDSYTVDKANGQVAAREVADKQVMTVRTAEGTEEQMVSESLRQAPSLTDAQVVELGQLGVQIESLYGMPMDVEWCLADGRFFIVQARPITALLEQTVEPPTEWPMPDPKSKYVRASIIDLMPDPVSPLFTTMAFKAYDAGLTRAMSDITRSKAVLPEHFLTINDYVYSDTRLNGRQTWWLLTRMLPSFPRMIRTGVSYWREHGRPPYVDTVWHWEGQPLATLSATDLLDGAREIVRAAMFNLTAQMVWMGACAGSEMLFTRVYNRLVKRTGDPDATAFLMGYDSTPIRAEKSLYDLAEWVRDHPGLADHILNTPASDLAIHLSISPSLLPIPYSLLPDWPDLCARLQVHLNAYGHIIYNLDFAKPLPLDDPAPMLETLKLYLRGEGANPHERQGALEARRVQATEAALSRVRGLKGWAFRKALNWAQSLAKVREDAFADIGLGYPVLRRVLRELGGRLVNARILEHPDDIFWLRLEELEQAVAMLEQETALPGMMARIGERRAFSRAAGRVTPPPLLPTSAKKVMGVNVEGMVAVGEGSHTDNTIKGAGTSAGRVTAPACVLHGPEDFSRMQPGRILVASLTTPAWTPLFAMATGVVTDIGGPLSHGSIVAREYGIPAVMGTGVATRRIQNGQTITVDGGAGEVVLHKSEVTLASPAIEWKLPNPKGQYMRSSVADLMPSPVSPLFETLAISTIARVGVKEVLRPLTRSEPILPDYILTINSYVYINGTYTLREWWWILTRMMLSMPRMLREALPLWRDKIRPRYVATVARWHDRAPEALPLDELWAGIQELNDAAMLHFSSLLVATTGASAGAEILFTSVYNKLIRRVGDPEAPVFLMGYDSTPIQAEKSLYDLAEWARAHPDLAEHILTTPTAEILRTSSELRTPQLVEEFNARLQTHLDAYGHIIYDLDFARLLPLDDPTPMLETIKMYLRGEGVNPHERQRGAEEKRIQSVEATRARLRGLRRWAFDKALKAGQSMAQVRENALADIGLGYPTLRALLRELGRRFAQAGSIEKAEDIFWLQAEEVQGAMTALARGLPPAALTTSVEQRKARHAALERVVPPPMLPPRKKYMGIDMEHFTPATEESQVGGTLKGIAASAGRVTAPACVLHGPEDFDRMKPGCVLVAGTTTPAWTPLFAMASAVVTDVGGPLSHGSIVAREYGIPAVMGTGVATRRIKSGQTITVDGGAGMVTLLKE